MKTREVENFKSKRGQQLPQSLYKSGNQKGQHSPPASGVLDSVGAIAVIVGRVSIWRFQVFEFSFVPEVSIQNFLRPLKHFNSLKNLKTSTRNAANNYRNRSTVGETRRTGFQLQGSGFRAENLNPKHIELDGGLGLRPVRSRIRPASGARPPALFAARWSRLQ